MQHGKQLNTVTEERWDACHEMYNGNVDPAERVLEEMLSARPAGVAEDSASANPSLTA